MKIAYCFLTYNDIIRYDIWNIYFESIKENNFHVFIHPKTALKHTANYTFPYTILKNPVITKGKSHISIVQATLRLFEEVPTDFTHIVFLSQSCIPLYPGSSLHNLIGSFESSVVSYFLNNSKERYFELSSVLKKHISFQQFVKQQPNMILVREDVNLFIQNNFTNYFFKMTCPDEHYFINLLLYVFKKKIILQQTHFCNPTFVRTQALEFRNISDEMIRNLRSNGFLFMRKVLENSIISNKWNLLDN